jgi:hypothetical protein
VPFQVIPRERSFYDLLEQAADDQGGDRRASQHVAEVDRMRLEELNVRAEVRAQIAAPVERDHQRLDPPDRQSDHEDSGDAPPRLGQRHGAPGEPRRDLAKWAHGKHPS